MPVVFRDVRSTDWSHRQLVVSHQTWVLRIELGSSRGADCAFKSHHKTARDCFLEQFPHGSLCFCLKFML